jgi:hypothetical protein
MVHLKAPGVLFSSPYPKDMDTYLTVRKYDIYPRSLTMVVSSCLNSGHSQPDLKIFLGEHQFWDVSFDTAK